MGRPRSIDGGRRSEKTNAKVVCKVILRDQAVFFDDFGFLTFSAFSGVGTTAFVDFFSFFSLADSFLLAGALLGVEGAGAGVAGAAAVFFPPFLAAAAGAATGAGTAGSSFESSSESSESSSSSSSVFSDSESSESLESDPATVEAVSRGLAAAASSAACVRGDDGHVRVSWVRPSGL